MRSIESQIDMDTVILPEKVYLPIIGHAEIRRRNRGQRQIQDECASIFKGLGIGPIRIRPTLFLGRLPKRFQLPEQSMRKRGWRRRQPPGGALVPGLHKIVTGDNITDQIG